MNSFFRTFLAALLAIVVANIVLGVFFVMIVSGLAMAFREKPVTVRSNSVLKVDLAGNITDAPQNMPFGGLDLSTFKMTSTATMYQVISAIDLAADDSNIRGIYLNLTGGGSIGMAQIEEIRNALEQFRARSGKFVVAYGDVYSQGGYYLSSVADKVYLNPQGGVMWQGLSSGIMFYKGLLDKLGIQPEVIRHGTYKAAVEPYIMDRMSPANRLQMNTLLGSVWNTVLGDVAASRDIPVKLLDEYASTLAIRSAMDAREKGLVDSLLYEDQMMHLLSVLADGDRSDKPAAGSTEQVVEGMADADAIVRDDASPDMVTLGEYIGQMMPNAKKISKNKISIVYADGDIVDGESQGQSIGGATVAAQLAEVRKDKNVKAVVFRVNSPGGSALASEVIWREVELLQREKPVIVSMSNYAASGGYYISCPADVILADRMTLTGSIGVFGLMFNVGPALEKKLGVTVDFARTNPSADMGTPFRGLSSQEKAYLTFQIEQIYDTFVDHVAKGRNMTTEAVDKIGEGRVWSGVNAREIGLVDGFGGLRDALLLAADRAGVGDDYRITEVMPDGNELSMLLRMFATAGEARMQDEMGEAFVQYNHLMQAVRQQQSIQARMPFVPVIR